MKSARPRILFFGSFVEYSAIVLEKLLAASQVQVIGVVTTPPTPLGRKRVLTPTPVHQLAEAHHLPVFTPESLTESTLHDLQQKLLQTTGKTTPPAATSTAPFDLIVTAGYGKLLPATWLRSPQLAALNLHFSLLPSYRGANPAEWALLSNEPLTGVTVIEMSPEFDTGHLVAQAAIAINQDDTRQTIYQRLYELGGEILPEIITAYVSYQTHHSQPATSAVNSSAEITYFLPPIPQPPSPTLYAKRFTREDAFIAWSEIKKALLGQPLDPAGFSPLLQTSLTQQQLTPTHLIAFVERAVRALAGFPGVWTTIATHKGDKRLKILAAHLDDGKLVLNQVQLEGLQPSSWNEVQNQFTELE